MNLRKSGLMDEVYSFIGVRKSAGSSAKFASTEMDEACYEKVHEFAQQGHQVLVFVRARNATAKLAIFFRDRAAKLVSFLELLNGEGGNERVRF